MKPLTAIFLLLLASVSLKETVAEVSKPVEIERELSIAEHMLTVSNSLGVVRRLDQSLCKVAQDYADLLARTHQQGHFADGDPEYRAKRAGFTGSLRQPGKRLSNGEISYGLGEVLAFGNPTLEEAFEYEQVDASGRVHRGGWMHSPGHRSALLESTFDVCGFAKAKDANIWVGIFGNSQVAAAAPPGQVGQPVRTAPQRIRGSR